MATSANHLRSIGALALVFAIFILAPLTIAPSRAQTDNAAKPLRDYQQRHSAVDAETRLRVARGEYERLERQKQSSASQPSTEPTWVSLGPTNGAGRMVAIAPHPTDANTLYAGADAGGLWKTTDGGGSWVPLTDTINSLEVGAVAVAPSAPNTIYLGTGSLQGAGIGLLKSTDGGATWILPASVVSPTFYRLLVHPTNMLEVTAATAGGLLRSTDGGASWVNQLGGTGDVVRDPSNPQTLYAVSVNTSHVSVSKTTNNGATWVDKSAGLPPGSFSTATLAISPTDPLVLYVSFALEDIVNSISHIAKTTDGGESWVDLQSVYTNPDRDISRYLGNESLHNNALAVSPTNSGVVLAGGVNYIRSTDGGQTWQHAPMFNGDSPGLLHAGATQMVYRNGVLYIACDGGIWTSPDNGQTATEHNTGLVTREYNGVANDEVNRNRLLAGSRGNGTDRRPDGGGSVFASVFGTEGYSSPINPLMPEIAYATGTFGQYARTKEAGRASDPLSLFYNGDITPPFAQEELRSFQTELEMNANAPNYLYTYTYRVWASSDGGDSWRPLPTTTTDGSIWSGNPALVGTAVASAPTDPRVLLAVKLDTGINPFVIFRSTNGGMTWRRSQNTFSSIRSIEFDPHNPSIAYLVTGCSPDCNVMMTTDGGDTWMNRGAGLPPSFFKQVVRVAPNDSNTLYCGTDFGVYRSTDQGASWAPYGVGLPSVSVTDLRIFGDGTILRAATYGRGIWEAVTPTANHPPSATIHSPTASVRILKGTTLTFRGTVADQDAGDTATGAWTFADTWESVAAPRSTTSVLHTFDKAGAYWVSLAARDSHGARNAAAVLVNVDEPFDNCATPLIIPSAGPFPYVVQTSNEAADEQGTDPPACSSIAKNLWFEFTPEVSGTYDFLTSWGVNNFPMYLSAYTGPPCGPYSALPNACSTGGVTVTAQAGVTIRLEVGGPADFHGRPFTLTVTRRGGSCAYVLEPTAQRMSANGGSASFDVLPVSICEWSASTNVNWITLQPGSNGIQRGTVHYSVAANTGPARSGAINVAGLTFVVTQEAAGCSYSLSASSTAISAVGQTQSVNVIAPGGCAWIASSNADWLTINSGASGSGNGTVTFTVAANPGRNARTGELTIAGQSFTITQAGASLRKAAVDTDADVRTELGFYRDGLWGFLKSSLDYDFCCAQFFSWGGAGLQPIAADFDGDGKSDVAYIVPPTGGQSAAYAILLSSRNYDFSQPVFVPAGFPSLGDTPVVGDFDGDGKADPGIWRSSQGVWIIPKSSTNYTQFIFTQWGQAGDTPIVADLDGDGRADIGFYRNGLWGFLKSSQSYSFGSSTFFSWGGAGLQPVIADFDGDGKSDPGYIVPPSGGQSAAYAILLSAHFYSFQAGQPLFVPAGFPSLGDTPVVGDFDGDGKADPGLWRSSQGVWIIPKSSTNYSAYLFSQWGQAGDVALPNNPAQH